MRNVCIKKIGWTFLITVFLVFGSCKYSDKIYDYQDGDFAISLPEYLKPMEGLGETTPYQYGNQFRNFYMIIEQKDKAKSTLNLEQYAVQSVEQLLATPTVSEPDTVSITPINRDGLRGQHLFMKAKVGGRINEIILYHLLHIESNKNQYHIALWTWEKWEEKYKEVIPPILDSFKEVVEE